MTSPLSPQQQSNEDATRGAFGRMEVEDRPTPKSKLLVVNNHHIAKRVRLLLTEDWLVLPAGGAVVGYHFDLIVFANGWDDGPGKSDPKLYEWAMHPASTRKKSDQTVVLY